MRFLPYLMDMAPIENEIVDVEIVEKTSVLPAILIIAATAAVAVCLIITAIKKNKK
ncbi:MAG: hypothetical protein IJ306_00555 [Oscillospiraceae bacterium]|nr:hypothetical protein [Oscillospiraceae bacterium]